MSEEAVKVSVKRVQREEKEYVSYAVAIPKRFAEELGIRGGDILHVRIVEVELEGRGKVRGLLYYKP